MDKLMHDLRHGDGRMEEAAPPAEPVRYRDTFEELAHLRRRIADLEAALAVKTDLAEGAEARATAYLNDVKHWQARALQAEATAARLHAEAGSRYVRFNPTGLDGLAAADQAGSY